MQSGRERDRGRERGVADYMEFCAVAHRNAKLMKSHADKTKKKTKKKPEKKIKPAVDDEVAQSE